MLMLRVLVILLLTCSNAWAFPSEANTWEAPTQIGRCGLSSQSGQSFDPDGDKLYSAFGHPEHGSYPEHSEIFEFDLSDNTWRCLRFETDSPAGS